MKPLEAPRVRIVIYEGAGATTLEADERFDLMAALLDQGHTVTCTGTGIDTATSGAVASVEDSTLVVLGRFDDAQAPDAEDADGRVRLLMRDITDKDAEAVVTLVGTTLASESLEINHPGQWKPWFPVIDYTRCTNCMQCLSFCLFDVYGVDSQNEIQVQNNDNCKTDCPACSRVCPEVAIMFPKYKAGPINGEEVSAEAMNRETMKVDISSLLGGDIYASLRDRTTAARERFSKERDDKLAISERMRCLTKLQNEMDRGRGVPGGTWNK
ncbi:MAG: ferredoxin family protein [Planctomycetota bacterium]|jgi:Pyruvate/2-oxoacid:ferredoxin oxidoreductase delta subunit